MSRSKNLEAPWKKQASPDHSGVVTVVFQRREVFDVSTPPGGASASTREQQMRGGAIRLLVYFVVAALFLLYGTFL